jgi:hypothetical protein
MSARDSKQGMTRREFLLKAAVTSGAAWGATVSPVWAADAVAAQPQSRASRTPGGSAAKTVLSFYVDDTNPYIAGVEAFKMFLDFVAGEGIAGESSVILGSGWEEHGLLSRPKTDEQRAYIEQLRRAYECGIDSHMELMTHGGLFDFGTGRVPDGAQHEGVWLYEPAASLEAYESYFGHVIEEGEKIGVRFTGVTWPGCGCAICQKRNAELSRGHPLDVNLNVWKALLNLAKRGKFRGRTVPCFVLGGPEEHPLKLMAGEGEFGVYDLYPNADDHLGIWENDPARVSADYYITADGASGRIVEKVRAGAPRCVLYGHWQGVNPVKGVGWEAFKQVVHRVQKHYADRVVWMRPSALTDLYHRQAGNKGV